MKTKAKALPPQEEMVILTTEECPQRSPQWFAERKGMVTASVMSSVMASSEDQKMRKKLLYRLAAELITETPVETYQSAAMLRGIEMEGQALKHYAFTRTVDVLTVGFIKRKIPTQFGEFWVGCSPDGLIGDDGIVQVKTMSPELLAEFIDSGRLPSEHKWQCHTEIWITGRVWCDLKLFWPGMPSPVYRFERNEGLIAPMREAVEKFDWDLRKMVERLRSMS